MKRKEQFVQTRRLERITVTRTRDTSHTDSRCELCGCSVEWLTLTRVAAIAGIAMEQVRRNAVNGKYHVRLTPLEQILVCSRSVVGKDEGLDSEEEA